MERNEYFLGTLTSTSCLSCSDMEENGGHGKAQGGPGEGSRCGRYEADDEKSRETAGPRRRRREKPRMIKTIGKEAQRQRHRGRARTQFTAQCSPRASFCKALLIPSIGSKCLLPLSPYAAAAAVPLFPRKNMCAFAFLSFDCGNDTSGPPPVAALLPPQLRPRAPDEATETPPAVLAGGAQQPRSARFRRLPRVPFP